MGRPLRVLWLLNHTTLRRFELAQLLEMGVEVFTPKSFPYDEGNLSASVDWSTDETLTIQASDLAILNQQDWYGQPSTEAWAVANEYFDVAIIGFFPEQIDAASRYFHGQVVLRAFGLGGGLSYTELLYQLTGPAGFSRLLALGSRFWFGAGNDHLVELKDALCMTGLSESELAACYGLADLAVNPSLSEGGMPFTFTEALSVGTPVVMGDIEVTREVLTDPEVLRATVFDPYDWRALADKIEWALEHRSELYAIQRRFYDEQLAHRTWDDVVGEHTALLDRLSEGTLPT